MRFPPLALALPFAAALLAARPDSAAAQAAPASPCADSLYAALRAKPLQELSEREYQYFMQREKACTDYQTLNRLVNEPPAARAPAPSRAPETETYTRESSFGAGADVYVRNISSKPIIVNSVRVYECQGVRDTSCGMHYPKAKLHPGQSRRVLTIRFIGESQRAGYRYTYHVSAAES